ncbi:membrane protein [Mycobacterium phage Yuna]|uniref:Uncharacterized protein n=1 Tax=Mycobacterium phage Yuna TaxID=2599885 RepID=A0A5J6TF19_9CAUD|nr:membrane protein [Mycobacterium phage Yuna]QFG09461.1 hypothetical protein PBI_YUNA_79 [Mycobacterium phage Yuna]
MIRNLIAAGIGALLAAAYLVVAAPSAQARPAFCDGHPTERYITACAVGDGGGVRVVACPEGEVCEPAEAAPQRNWIGDTLKAVGDALTGKAPAAAPAGDGGDAE